MNLIKVEWRIVSLNLDDFKLTPHFLCPFTPISISNLGPHEPDPF